MPCNNLRAEMAIRRISIENIATCLNIHRNSVANKINGETSFSIEESVKIQENFFPDLELKYLFERKVKGKESEKMWVWKMLQKKRQYSEAMYRRWVSGLIGLSISILIWIIAIIVSFK